MRTKWSIKLTCENCGEEFKCEHKDRLKRKHHFCCKKCEGEYRKKQTKLNCVCPICGTKFHLKQCRIAKSKQENCCSRKCLSIYRSKIYQGENNPNYGNIGCNNPIWKSDIKISPYGYVLIRNRNHPFANCDGFVFEHRLVAEKYLLTPESTIEINGQKYLSPDYIVHHINGDKQDNRKENLKIMTLSEHTSLHQKKQDS